MNKALTENIIRHILYNFAILPCSFIDSNKTKSLKSKEFLISETLPFEYNEENISNHVWACQISAEKQEVKIILGDCKQENNIKEFCLLVELKDAPIYGMYLVINDDMNISSEPLIACSIDGKDWMECQTFLQATFLAGMEQIRDAGFSWNKCSEYKNQYNSMLSFIKFHNKIYEVKDEGEKD